MMRLSVVVLERDERAALRGLGRLGAVHLLRTKAGPDTAPLAPPDRTLDLARCDDLLSRVENLLRRMEIDPALHAGAEPAGMTLEQAQVAFEPVEARAGELLERRRKLQQQWAQVRGLLDKVAGYEGLALPFDRLGQFAFLHFAIGSLPEKNFETLQEQVGENVVLLPLARREGRRPVVAVTSRKGRFALETTLKQAGFQAETLPTQGATAETLSQESRREIHRLDKQLEEINAEVAALAREVASPLVDLQRFLATERRVLEAEQNFPRTDSTVLITGWAPAADTSGIQNHLQEVTGGRCIVETSAPDDVPEAEIPVLLRHPRLLRPFEMLVAGYGLPAYRELEPTLFVAVTYVLMFGMMFGDAGHGAVLVIGGLVTLLTGRSAKARDVGLLLATVGLSSVVFGVVYGSYFGLTGLKRYALWHDPLEGDPMALMYTAVGIGIGIISLGLVLNVINRFRRRDLVGGFLDKFGVAGAVFYWGVLALILKYAVFKEAGLVELLVVAVIVAPLLAVALKEPIQYALQRRAGHHTHAGSFMEACLESAIEAFEAVLGYMANTISFIRLAAYALSHAAVLMATFVMAAEVAKVSSGPLGGVLEILVIILGNLVAILLEGVIAAAQAVRLEWYEFFGKFFSGSGLAFKPFRFAAEE
jgi:V/A-type H+-transporting ATPase subunit I